MVVHLNFFLNPKFIQGLHTLFSISSLSGFNAAVTIENKIILRKVEENER